MLLTEVDNCIARLIINVKYKVFATFKIDRYMNPVCLRYIYIYIIY